MAEEKVMTPLEMLNRYYAADVAFESNRGTLWHKMNELLSWENLMNKDYQPELRPLLYYIIAKRMPNIDQAPPSDRGVGETIPHHIVDNLKNDYLRNLKRNMILLGEWERLRKEFISNDIKFITLKGAYLAENVYEHFACRPMADIDILVKEQDIERCRQILNEGGYVRMPEENQGKAIHDTYLQAGPCGEISMELHRRLTNALYGARFDLGGLWGGTYLPLEYNLVYLSWHAVRHSFVKLIWLCDCAELLRKYHAAIDWEDVVCKSDLYNARKQVQLCLHLIGSLLIPEISGRFPMSTKETVASQIGERILFTVQKTLARQRDPDFFTKLLTIHTMERKTLFKFAFAYLKQ